MLRGDLSAGTWVSGGGDAARITLFPFYAPAFPASPLYGNPNAINLGVWGRAPVWALQLFDLNRVAGGQTAPNAVQLAVAVCFIAQIFSGHVL